VSPPASGPVISFSEVVHGGWISYETSECQRSMLGKGSERGEEVLYTTVCLGVRVSNFRGGFYPGFLGGGVGKRNEPWTSSKPGSFGIGVVACLWSGPQ